MSGLFFTAINKRSFLEASKFRWNSFLWKLAGSNKNLHFWRMTKTRNIRSWASSALTLCFHENSTNFNSARHISSSMGQILWETQKTKAEFSPEQENGENMTEKHGRDFRARKMKILEMGSWKVVKVLLSQEVPCPIFLYPKTLAVQGEGVHNTKDSVLALNPVALGSIHVVPKNSCCCWDLLVWSRFVDSALCRF